MKILVATSAFPPEIGGPATYSSLLADSLPKMGIEVDVFSFGRVRHMPKVIRHLAYGLMLLWHARKAELVFAQDASSVGFPAILASFILGKLFMVRVPGDYAWEQSKRLGVTDTMENFQNKKYGRKIEKMRSVQKFVVNNSDAVIVPSNNFAEVVKRWTKDPNKVRTIYNGVDLGDIEKTASGIAVRPKTIISAGRLVHNKGFGMLIKAMNKLPDWSLEIAGDGPERDKLEKLISADGLAGRARLLGRLDRAELIRKIAGSEIFALNTYYETFSFQTIEAMAAGTPVAVAGVGSLKEIITDGVNGVLFKPDSEDEFLAAVNKIHSDPALKAWLITGGKARARDFSIASTVEAVKKIIGSLTVSPVSVEFKRRAKVSRIVRYLFSGGCAAVTNILLLFIFTDVAHIWYLFSSILSFIISFVVSFSLQKFFTFQDHDTDGVHGQALVYLLVTGTNLLINTALIFTFVEYADFHYIPAQIVTSILVAIESYIIYGMFIFNKKK